MTFAETAYSVQQRDSRFISHALVEIKKSKLWPFGTISAVLLDISLSGCKVELTQDVTLKVGEQYWLSIPLSPLKIFAPEYLFLKMECRWFDEEKYRFGCVFMNLDLEQKDIIIRIINNAKKITVA